MSPVLFSECPEGITTDAFTTMQIKTLTPQAVDVSGTSFFGSRVCATPNQIIALFGVPLYFDLPNEKVTHEWNFSVEDEEGNTLVATLYDWKEYHILYGDEVIYWHIGGFNGEITSAVAEYINSKLNA